MMGSPTAGIGSTLGGDFRQSRLDPEPNSGPVELRSQVQAAILMAMGVDAALANGGPKAGALQAAHRSLLTGSGASLARIVSRESRRKLEREYA